MKKLYGPKDTYTIDDLNNLSADGNEFYSYLKSGFKEQPLVAITKQIEQPKKPKNQPKSEKSKKDKKTPPPSHMDPKQFAPYRPNSQQQSQLRPQSMPVHPQHPVPQFTVLSKQSGNATQLVPSGKSGLTITKPNKTLNNPIVINQNTTQNQNSNQNDTNKSNENKEKEEDQGRLLFNLFQKNTEKEKEQQPQQQQQPQTQQQQQISSQALLAGLMSTQNKTLQENESKAKQDNQGPPGFTQPTTKAPKDNQGPPGFSNPSTTVPTFTQGPPGFSQPKENQITEPTFNQGPPGFEQPKQSTPPGFSASSIVPPQNVQEPQLSGPPGFGQNPSAPPGFSTTNDNGNSEENNNQNDNDEGPVYITSSPTDKQRKTMSLLFPGYEPYFEPEVSKRVQMQDSSDNEQDETSSEQENSDNFMDDYNPMGASFTSSYGDDEEEDSYFDENGEEDFSSIDSDEVEEDFDDENIVQDHPPGFDSQPIQQQVIETSKSKEEFTYKSNICDFNGDTGMILDVENQCASIFHYINSKTILLNDLKQYQITSGCCLSNSFVFAGNKSFVFICITNNETTPYEIPDEICPCKMIKADPLSSNKFFALSCNRELYAVQYNSETKELKKNKLYDQEFLAFDVSSKYLITKVKETKIEIRDRTESNFLPIRTQKIETNSLIFCDDTFLYTYFPRDKICNLIKINNVNEQPKYVSGVTLAWTSANGVALLYGSKLLINGDNYPYTNENIAGIAVFSSQAALWEDISKKATILPLNTKKNQEVSQTGSSELARVTRIFYNKISENEKKHKRKVEEAIEKYSSAVTSSLRSIHLLTESLHEPITQIQEIAIENGLTPHACLKLSDTDPDRALKIASEKGKDHILYLLNMGAIERILQDGSISQTTLLLLLPAVSSVLSNSSSSIRSFNLILDLLDKEDLLVSLTLSSLKQYLHAMVNKALNENNEYQNDLQQIKEKLN